MALDLCRASRDERRRLPGDDLVPQPMAVITHAITIAAPPRGVWPWLAQMGSGRAGWYAYDHIDNGGAPSARRIVPELQRVAIGDILPWLPGVRDGFMVGEVIPERALVLVAPLQTSAVRTQAATRSSVPALRMSWALVLDPLDKGRTRLIARGRVSRDWLTGQEANVTTPGEPIFIERVYGLLATLPRPLLLAVAGFGHYLMESRTLRGVKRRAERGWAAERAEAEASERPAGAPRQRRVDTTRSDVPATGLVASVGYRRLRTWLVAHRLTAQAIAAIKLLHTAVFLVDAACVLNVAYSGIRNRVTSRTKASLGAVVGEGIVLALNRGRCPLTVVVEDLGAAHGSVSDIFLPDWLARRVVPISGSLLGLGLGALALQRMANPR